MAGLPGKLSLMVMALQHSGIAIDTDVIKTKLIDIKKEKAGSALIGNIFNRMENCPRCFGIWPH